MQNSVNVPVWEQYSFEKKPLNVGRESSISQATHRSTGLVRVIKSTRKRASTLERLQQEVSIMMTMDHPNIVKLVETFEDQRSIHLVMELCSGGLLIDRIVEVGSFSEVHAAILMKQILRAVFFMHESDVCHRDLTVDKFMFLSKAPIEEGLLKLVDFKCAARFQQGMPMLEKTESSSLSSYAPELLCGRYNEKCDVWSCGVIMFILLSGHPPVSGTSPKDIMETGRRGEFNFDAKYLASISEDAQHLVRKLLKVRPLERYSAEQALNHAWVAQMAPNATRSLNLNFLKDLKSLRSVTLLKKVALQVMVGQFSEHQLSSLRDIFVALDLNGDGMLTIDEMREGLSQAGLGEIPAELQSAIEDIDLDGSGAIDYSEFLVAALEKKQYVQEDACWNVFNFFDKNRDGKISPEELRQALISGSLEDDVSKDVVDQVLREVDRDGSGEIDFPEFMHMMQQDAFAY
jgi:calcium-dependent protein kinase